MGHLWDALSRAYDALGFPQATGHDEVFRQLVLERIIEQSSKQDSLRFLEETGIAGPSYPTLNRRLPVWAEDSWRQGLSEACAAYARPGVAGPLRRVLYFEADQGDGFREPGLSKERRLEPQITIACSSARTSPVPANGTYSKPGSSMTASPSIPRTIRDFRENLRLRPHAATWISNSGRNLRIYYGDLDYRQGARG
jgi:hypothetical protein